VAGSDELVIITQRALATVSRALLAYQCLGRLPESALLHLLERGVADLLKDEL